jgi:hypothetical protein
MDGGRSGEDSTWDEERQEGGSRRACGWARGGECVVEGEREDFWASLQLTLGHWTSGAAASSPCCSAPGRFRLPLGPLARRSGLADPPSARPGPLQGPGVLLSPRGARPCNTSWGTGGIRLGPGVARLRGSLGVRRPTPCVANGFVFRRCPLVMLGLVSPALSWGEARPMSIPA